MGSDRWRHRLGTNSRWYLAKNYCNVNELAINVVVRSQANLIIPIELMFGLSGMATNRSMARATIDRPVAT